MTEKCQGCGAEKDPAVLEVYPHPEDHITDRPISPFFSLDVEDWNLLDGPFRTCRVCHECFHKLEPDMWISSKGWDSINPVVPFKDLPLLVVKEKA